MADRRLREARITSDECRSADALHAYLQDALGLPEHYGRNLAALADCLAETCSPVLVTLAIEPSELPAGMQAHVMRLAQVCAREALANGNVSLIVEHP